MARIDIRCKDKLKNQIDELAEKTETNPSEMIRELLEIGVFVKNKQLKGDSPDKKNWKEVHRYASHKTLESRAILNSLFNMLFDKDKSRFDSAKDELDFISNHVEEVKKEKLHLK